MFLKEEVLQNTKSTLSFMNVRFKAAVNHLQYGLNKMKAARKINSKSIHLFSTFLITLLYSTFY